MDSNSFPEKFLYHIWDAQHIKYIYNNKALKTVSGKDIKIHFQGHYNTMEGPDFKNASIEINDKEFIGDIEIHINSTDWYAHHHEENKAFNNVILHVVYNHNQQYNKTLNESNKKIEKKKIKNLLSEEIEILFKKYSEKTDLNKERFCNFFSLIRPEFFEQELTKNGWERLQKKVNRFGAELSFVSIDQLVYQSILEAMGYSKNKYQFYQFSKDYTWIHYKNKVTQENLSIKGFIDLIVADAQFDTKKYEWNISRIRPCNHPKVRLIQIATFIYKSFSTSCITEVQKLFSFTKYNFKLNEAKKQIYNVLCNENGFTKYKLGKERINTIIINIFIPLLLVFSKLNQDLQLGEICYKIYEDFTSLEENHIDNIMNKYMTETQYKKSQSKAIYQQGLMNIYYKYCINHLCELCEHELKN
jgi:hypothetical protein